MHRLVKEPDGTTILYIGAHNWPTPIPLVNKGSSWYFDTEAGKKEILYRRIGRNELSAIRVCQELVAAQKEYSAQHKEYAQKIFSDEGQHNGLYWKAAAGEPQSPIGPLVASAVAEGYGKSLEGPPTPYRGYYFHILVRQGKNGRAKSYIVNGKMTEGFAFVAYPAEYRSSGVMTFIVDQDGVVHEKDLGKKTDVLAKAMKEYNPNSTWRKAEEQRKRLLASGKPSRRHFVAAFRAGSLPAQKSAAWPHGLYRLPAFVSRASAAESFRSRCGSVRNAPVCSSQASLIAAPQVGQGTDCICFSVSSFVFTTPSCNASTVGKCSIMLTFDKLAVRQVQRQVH